ncbi:MAG TPA: cytochrome c [Vicinamibacterales bacterium]|jgi:mono/diheme cytochrome c family protein|nr:cytochrome c [Vicinamibacterales bacterium]
MGSILHARSWTQVLAAGVALVAGAAPVIGQTPPAVAPAIEQGKDIYRQYCAACHGEQGTGNGPAASSFKTRPTDLTRLAARTGKFSAAEVEAVIKGVDEPNPARPAAPDHEPIPAHGSYAMPVWGPYFTAVRWRRTRSAGEAHESREIYRVDSSKIAVPSDEIPR